VSFVAAEDKRISQDFVIPAGESGKAKAGQVVTVEIISQPGSKSKALGRVVEVLGNYADPGMEIEIALRKHELPFEFSKEALAYTRKIPDAVRKKDTTDREDIRHLPLVTIDGETAKDFDDDCTLAGAHARGRFVQHQHSRLASQGDRKLQTLAVARSKLARRAFSHVSDTYRLKQVDCFAPMPFPSDGEQASAVTALRHQGKLDVLTYAQSGENTGDLKRAREPHPRAQMRRNAGDPTTLKDDFSPGGGQQSGCTVEEGALAGTVGPDDGVDLTRSQFDRHAIERLEVAELLGQIARCKDGLRVHDRLPAAERQF
jgi:hypothetical protein